MAAKTSRTISRSSPADCPRSPAPRFSSTLCERPSQRAALSGPVGTGKAAPLGKKGSFTVLDGLADLRFGYGCVAPHPAGTVNDAVVVPDLTVITSPETTDRTTVLIAVVGVVLTPLTV